MSGRDARDDWRGFAAESIPTKKVTPQLDAFLDRSATADGAGRRPSLLDVGCGDGRLSVRMHERCFAVTGIDVNEGAVAAAQRLAAEGGGGPRPRFVVADAAGAELPHGLGEPFDVVVCQLVVSIVGGPEDRARLLRTCAWLLRPQGRLFLSASGISGHVNPTYERLYVQDAALTGEPFTYWSRDESGRVLYATHHFSAAELEAGMAAAGLTGITITPVHEASSRRPHEQAIFLYATATKPSRSTGADRRTRPGSDRA